MRVLSREQTPRADAQPNSPAAIATHGQSGTLSGSDTFSFLLPPVESDEIGRLGNYRVLSLLGRGGMGLVFLAEDIGLRRRIALKVMRPDLMGEPNSWQRFLREARLMASMKHDHLATVYQVGQENGIVYLAMELLHGETLADRIGGIGPATPKEIVRVGREIAAALAAIHQQGFVHRDVKPANLWLESPKDRVKVLDFGLARVADDGLHCTQTGMVVGTPGFMSPEQARGEPVDGRSDLFSLGSVLYYMSTSVEPFHSSTTMGILTALAVTTPLPPHQRNAAIPRALSKLIMRLLDKEISGRPRSADDVIAELDRIRFGSETGSNGTIVDRPASRRARGCKSSDRTLVLPRTNSRRWIWWSAGAAMAIGTIALVAVFMRSAADGHTPNALSAAFGEMTFLTSLKPFESKNWIDRPPLPPPDAPPRPDGAPDPRSWNGVTVKGRPSSHGLFMHPPLSPYGGTSSISYRLDKRFREFHVQVSLNDGPRWAETPVTFKVYGDGKPLWSSRPVQAQSDVQHCDLAIAGVEVLTLEIDCPGEPRGAHCVWIEPHLRD